MPNTIEHYMMEEQGQHMAYIWQMQDKRNNRKTSGPELNKHPRKEMVDKFCNFCGTFGHTTTNCKFMAKLLIANESITKVDGKVKKELQEIFWGEQQKFRERHLETKANVIQKLLDTGASKEDIEKVLETLSDSVNGDNEDDRGQSLHGAPPHHQTLNDCLVWFGRLHLLYPNRNHLLYQ